MDFSLPECTARQTGILLGQSPRNSVGTWGGTMSVFLTLPHSFPCFADLTMVWGKIELLQKILDLKYHVHFSDVVREDKFDPRCRPGMWDGSIRALHAD